MKEFVKPALILTVVTLAAGILLAGVNSLTNERIARIAEEKEKESLSRVLPDYTIIGRKEHPNRNNTFYWIAEKTVDGKSVTGYAFITEKAGYSGTIRIMVGVNESMTITGISVLSQSETPGLGARITEVASKNTIWDAITGNARFDGDTTPWFQKQFRNLDATRQIFIVKKGDWKESMADDLQQNNEISAITGATITTKAVRDGVEEGIDTFRSVIQQGR